VDLTRLAGRRVVGVFGGCAKAELVDFGSDGLVVDAMVVKCGRSLR